MKKILIFLLGFYIGAVIFMPKKAIFYKIQELIPQINIEAQTKQTPISLNLQNIKIFYASIDSADIKKVKIFPFILYNQADIYDLNVKSINLTLKNIKIIFTPFYPIKAFIFGDNLNGFINLKERKIHITFKNPPSSIRGFLKKTEKGYVLDERY
jgi:hypothetical protein